MATAALETTQSKLEVLHDTLTRHRESVALHVGTDPVLVCLGLEFWVQVPLHRGLAIIDRKLERINATIADIKAVISNESVVNSNENALKTTNAPCLKRLSAPNADPDDANVVYEIQEPLPDNDSTALDSNCHRVAHMPEPEVLQPAALPLDPEKRRDLQHLNELCEKLLAEEEANGLDDPSDSTALQQPVNRENDFYDAHDGVFQRHLMRDVNRAFFREKLRRKKQRQTSSDLRVSFALPEDAPLRNETAREERWLNDLNRQMRDALDLAVPVDTNTGPVDQHDLVWLPEDGPDNEDHEEDFVYSDDHGLGDDSLDDQPSDDEENE